MVIITLLLVPSLGAPVDTDRAQSFHGGRPAAWLAGIRRDRYLLAGFACAGSLQGRRPVCGELAMTSAAVSSRTLMTVLAAVIIGGARDRRQGRVLKSYCAVLLLTTLFNRIGCFDRIRVQILRTASSRRGRVVRSLGAAPE